MNRNVGFILLTLMALSFAACSNQRYAHRQFVRMEPVEAKQNPRIESVTIIPKNDKPTIAKGIVSDSICWESSTSGVLKQPQTMKTVEERTFSERAENQNKSAQQLPTGPERTSSEGDGLVILSIVLHIVGAFISLIGLLGSALGLFASGGAIVLAGLALVVLSYILFYRGLAKNLVANHRGSDRPPSYYRRKGFIGFLISLLISLLGGLTVIIYGIIYWIVHRNFANYLEDSSN